MDWMHNNILRIAEVLEVHPESNSISVRFVDDGSRIPDIPVMSSSGSSRTGTVDLPTPEVPEDETHDPTETERVYSLAVIAMTSTLGVSGFVQPAVNELAFKDMPNLRVWRHASDAYSVIDDKANMAIVHPGGASIEIGKGAFDPEGKDYDKKWKIRRNQTPAVITLRNAGAVIEIDELGNILVESPMKVHIIGHEVEVVAGRFSVAAGDASFAVKTMTIDASISTKINTGLLEINAESVVGNAGTFGVGAGAIDFVAANQVNIQGARVVANGSPVSRIGDVDSNGDTMVTGAG